MYTRIFYIIIINTYQYTQLMQYHVEMYRTNKYICSIVVTLYRGGLIAIGGFQIVVSSAVDKI